MPIRRKQTNGYKANSYIIPRDVMKEMDEQIKDTHETGKEHGMSLCADKKAHTINVGYKSVGTEMGISISERCRKKNETYMGSFHTHPDDSEAAASAQDLFSSCLEMSNLDCIGKNKKGEIVCYVKKEKKSSCVNDAEPLKDIEDVFHEIPEDALRVIKKDLYEEVDKVAAKHFNLQKIK